MLVKRIASELLVILGTIAGLAACSSTTAGPNAGATSGNAPVASTSSPTVGQEVGAVATNHVDVTFPKGGAVLTPEANQQLDLAARLFRDANPVVMFTTGYTDRSGDEYNNVLLSAKRAEAVKRGLVARGIPPERLLIRALGESELANTANPEAPENRRVAITWRLL